MNKYEKYDRDYSKGIEDCMDEVVDEYYPQAYLVRNNEEGLKMALKCAALSYYRKVKDFTRKMECDAVIEKIEEEKFSNKELKRDQNHIAE